MTNNSIIQFLGFVTDLDTGRFLSAWEEYSKQLSRTTETANLLQEGKGNNKFDYVSQHESSEGGLSFEVIQERGSRNWREPKIKIVYIGGYIPVQIEYDDKNEAGDVRIIAFLRHEITDFRFYKQLVPYKYLNIYEEYYENCQYSYVMEFFAQEKDAADLLVQLNARTGIRAAVYTECFVTKN